MSMEASVRQSATPAVLEDPHLIWVRSALRASHISRDSEIRAIREFRLRDMERIEAELQTLTDQARERRQVVQLVIGDRAIQGFAENGSPEWQPLTLEPGRRITIEGTERHELVGLDAVAAEPAELFAHNGTVKVPFTEMAATLMQAGQLVVINPNPAVPQA